MINPADIQHMSGTAPKTVLVVAGLAWSLVNFRMDLMTRMRANGHRVLAAAPDFDAETAALLQSHDIEPLTVPMNRTGLNPLRDLQTLQALRRVIRTRKPDLVLPYTMKPIIYGCMAARIEGDVPCHPLFTGLGYAFCDPYPRGKRRVVRQIAIRLHRIATRRTRVAFYYNPAEAQDLRQFRMLPPTARMVAIPGSGVETTRYAPTSMPEGETVFLFIARMLRSKGVEDLVAAARLLRAEGHRFRVDLVGPVDSNPDAVTPATLQAWHDAGEVVYHGPTRDVRPYLRNCHVFVLPTKLREGVPRTILEAMACARPVITTNAPGCGETLQDGESGLVVPRGAVGALSRAMRRFLIDPDLAARMGAKAREHVVRHNDVHIVNRLLLTEMDLEAPMSVETVPLAAGVS